MLLVLFGFGVPLCVAAVGPGPGLVPETMDKALQLGALWGPESPADPLFRPVFDGDSALLACVQGSFLFGAAPLSDWICPLQQVRLVLSL